MQVPRNLLNKLKLLSKLISAGFCSLQPCTEYMLAQSTQLTSKMSRASSVYSPSVMDKR